MKYLLFILLLLFTSLLHAQSVAWKRASKFGKGMNLTWLDQRWKGTDTLNHRDYLNVKDLPEYKKQIELMHEMGYTFLRLPVCFDLWYANEEPYNLLKPEYYSVLDSIVKWAKDYHMMLSIDNHHGKLNSKSFNSDANKICAIWKDVSARYKDSNPDQVFFEVFNEPHDITEDEWPQALKRIVKSIRNVDKEHTLIVGGGKWNSMEALMNMPTYLDKNIIYTFHFYDPFLFTHQGASWSGDAGSTIGVPYPYDEKRMPPISERAENSWAKWVYPKYSEEANYEALYKNIKTVKDWSTSNNVPIFCGEWGAYGKYANVNDRCVYLKDVYSILNKLEIPNAMWEWKEGFSFFTGSPAIENVSPCIKEALRLK